VNKESFRNILPTTFIAITILAVSHVFALLVKSEALRIAYFDIVSVIVNAFATLMLFLAAKRTWTRSRRQGMAWLFFGIAETMYTIGDILWMILEMIVKVTPYPSIADIFYLANYPFFLIGTILLSTERYSGIESLKRSLDILITLVAAMLGLWFLLIQPALAMGINNSPMTIFLTIAYPVGDIVLFIGLVWLLNNDPDKFTAIPVLLLFGGIFSIIIFDTIYSYQSYIGTYQSSSYLNLGWVLSYLLLGLAGFHQRNFSRAEKMTNQQRQRVIAAQNVSQNVLPYLPYLWMIFAYLLLHKDVESSVSRSYLALYIGVGVIIGLVVVRQFIALFENNRLNIKLRTALEKVEQQAGVLEVTNRELETEIKHRVTIEKRLTYDALHDSLTDLPNRALFMKKLREAIEITRVMAEKTYSVLYMDVDQFKVINDSLGHHMGDELLKILSLRLQNCLRSSDAIARLGGDEFVFLIENVPNENAVDFIVNRIRTELSSVIMLDEHPIFITTSIGVVWNLRGYESPENVLRDADLAMYHAKHLGKDRFEVFHEGLRLKAISRLEIEEDLRNAIKNHELMMYYQPILNLQENKVAGFEALIRWNHPRYGVVYPSEFLPTAAETGLDIPLGRWCLLEACTRAEQWLEKWPYLKSCYFSINVSGRQFTQDGFINLVKKVLHETKIDPSNIRLEITESALIDFNETVQDKFNQLRDLNIELSIDDFGTGYSSLSYLQKFPVGSLKLDQSFVREIGINKNSRDVIRSMVTLGQDLELDVIAEGIESPHQLEELKKLSLKYGQGFLLSLPLTGDEMDDYICYNCHQ
jgi:diguanylate cyclase (GGDEF)-like protein